MKFYSLTRFALLTAICLPDHAATPAPFDLRDGDRVLFIGDTFFEREVDYGHIETRLTAAFPNRHVIFRNLAWAADTPMGRSRASFDWSKPEQEWLKRVKEQVALVKPTVAFLSYGMTAALESGAGVSPGEEAAGIEKFNTAMNKLMDAIEEVSGSSPDVPKKDEKYWKDRMTVARDTATHDKVLLDALQSRVNALSADFVNTSDPAQRAVVEENRKTALNEMDRHTKDLAKQTKAVEALQEEARKAGVPPGWLR